MNKMITTSEKSDLEVIVDKKIKQLLAEDLLSNQKDVDEVYNWIHHYFNNEFFDSPPKPSEEPKLRLNDLSNSFASLNNQDIRTIGIDFPIKLSKGKNRPTLMVCAMDPLRYESESKNPSTEIGPWVPFSIINNPTKQKKYTERQNLLFFHTLLRDFDLYITDIYKVFYRKGNKRSNQLHDFTSLKIHNKILNKEIDIVNPIAILTLGNNARDALCNIKQLIPPMWNDEIYCTAGDRDIHYVMVPHISGAANGTKSPILRNEKYKAILGEKNEKYANIIISTLLKNID